MNTNLNPLITNIGCLGLQLGAVWFAILPTMFSSSSWLPRFMIGCPRSLKMIAMRRDIHDLFQDWIQTHSITMGGLSRTLCLRVLVERGLRGYGLCKTFWLGNGILMGETGKISVEPHGVLGAWNYSSVKEMEMSFWGCWWVIAIHLWEAWPWQNVV